MQGLNRISLIGNIGQEPELSYTQSGTALLKLRLGVSERVKKRDEWIEISSWFTVLVWAKRAEALSKLLHKGAGVMVEGPMRESSFEDKNGNKRTSFEVHANEVLLLGDGRRGGDRGQEEPRDDQRGGERDARAPQQGGRPARW